MIKKIFIYDLETFPQIFTATFIEKNSDRCLQFVISDKRDDRKSLFEFLNTEVKGLVGYNCIHFDGQIIEYLYRYPNCTVKEIRSYAEIITSDNSRFPDVPEWKFRIPHLDLFRAFSLSTKAKRTSLKWCEFMLDLDNIEDLPTQGKGDNWEEKVLSYNYNDVISTKKLYIEFHSHIDLRLDISKREGVNVLNSTEPGIANKLFLKWLSRDMGISSRDLKSMGTDRKWVKVSDIIFSYIHFKTKPLQQVKKEFEELLLHPGSKFEKDINYAGIKITFGLGGIHGVKKNTIMESNSNYVIKTLDVKSYYPNLSIKNKIHPKHIPQEIFCNLYENLYKERTKIPKSDSRNYTYKISLNSLYGMTNDKFSFLRDRKVTLSICINGQLLLMMLFEKLLQEIPGSKMAMINTDGGEIYIPREYEEKYDNVCKQWEDFTKLELEFDEYQKLVISDVNNYLGIFSNGKTKEKGKYEFKNIPLHKNKSHNIISIAIYEYFVNDKPIEETIRNHRNIFDFCAGVKAAKSGIKGASWYELHSVEKDSVKIEKLSKTVRYFISKKGKYLIKKFEDGSWAHVEAPVKSGKYHKDWKVTYFNKKFDVEKFEDYNIDYSYYISKARKWIYELEDKQQLKLQL